MDSKEGGPWPWSLLLAGRPSTSSSYINLGETQPLWLSLCLPASSAIIVTLYVNPLLQHETPKDIGAWLTSTGCIVLSTWYRFCSGCCSLPNMNVRYRDAHPLCSFLLGSPHASPAPLSPVLQYFQVPMQSTKLFTMIKETVYS